MALLYRLDPGGVFTPILLGVMTPTGVDLGDPPSEPVFARLHAAGWWAETIALPVVARLHAASVQAVPGDPEPDPEPEPVAARLHQAGPITAIPLPEPDPDPEPEPDPALARLHRAGPVEAIPA